MDTLKAIQVFVEITQQGSLTKAAEQLSMSRAMVSRYLEYLENKFGTRLMQRNTRRVALTQAGEEALIYCHNMLEQERLLSNLSAEIQNSGTIKVTAGHFLCREYMYEAITQFHQILPNVQFDVLSVENTVDLIEHNIDVALRVCTKIPEGFEGQRIGALTMCLVASPDYLYSKPELLQPQQLSQHQCLVHAQQAWQSWELTNQKGQTRTFPVNGSFCSNDVYGLYQMVSQNYGVTMLPMAMVAEDIQSGRLVRVLPLYHVAPLHVAAMYVTQSHMPMMVQTFIDFLHRFFAHHPKPLI